MFVMTRRPCARACTHITTAAWTCTAAWPARAAWPASAGGARARCAGHHLLGCCMRAPQSRCWLPVSTVPPWQLCVQSACGGRAPHGGSVKCCSLQVSCFLAWRALLCKVQYLESTTRAAVGTLAGLLHAGASVMQMSAMLTVGGRKSSRVLIPGCGMTSSAFSGSGAFKVALL